ncbi:YegP family protein [Aminobacter aminovorans]|uniref:YegP family protein n=1 Tax=Aminobacter aminovorans TaxID=83263 RepID=UPI0038D3E75B
MYKDVKGEWRWTYHAVNGEAIAVSSESYVRRADCRRGIDLVSSSAGHTVWFPKHLMNAT